MIRRPKTIRASQGRGEIKPFNIRALEADKKNVENILSRITRTGSGIHGNGGPARRTRNSILKVRGGLISKKGGRRVAI